LDEEIRDESNKLFWVFQIQRSAFLIMSWTGGIDDVLVQHTNMHISPTTIVMDMGKALAALALRTTH
jgi:hypothetical protein